MAPRAFDDEDYPHQELTGRIIESFYEVRTNLGCGYLESVYRRALAVELRFRGIAVAQEVPFRVIHRGVLVGSFRADLIAESTVIIETKAGQAFNPFAPVQLRNYLQSSGLPLGLVLYFGPKPLVKRVIASR